MRYRIFALILIAASLLAGCGAASQPPAETGEAPTLPSGETATSIADPASLVAALQAGGVTVEPAPGDTPPGLFDLLPQRYTASGGELHIYEFPDETSAQAAADTIPDLLMVTRWIAPPHFYHHGRLIVLYLGDDTAVTGSLGGLLGPQIEEGTGVEETGEAGTVDEVQLFLIAPGDQGASGDPIGCDDSVVGVTREITPTAAPIEAALNELLSIKEATYGESGLSNALYQSDLQVASVTLEYGLATVHLTGQLLLGGVCDNARVQAQLEYTVLQFPNVEGVLIYVNDTPLTTVLSGQG